MNVLRYEHRYKSRLPHLLGVNRVTGGMLYDKSFFRNLLQNLIASYQAISKVNDITPNFQAMKTKRDLYVIGVLCFVENFGGELSAIAYIDEARARGDLTAKQAYDLRESIKSACRVKEGLTAASDAIPELDKKIIEAVNYYL